MLSIQCELFNYSFKLFHAVLLRFVGLMMNLTVHFYSVHYSLEGEGRGGGR